MMMIIDDHAVGMHAYLYILALTAQTATFRHASQLIFLGFSPAMTRGEGTFCWQARCSMSGRQAITGGQGDGLKCLLCFALANVCTAAVTASCHLWRLQTTPAQLHNGTQQSRSSPKGRPGRGEGTLC